MKIAWLALVVACGKAEEPPRPTPAPTPPQDAAPPPTTDHMIRHAISTPKLPYFTASVELRYVAPDATLDPKYGGATVKVGKIPEPPKPPPDDPKRPLGAPPPERPSPSFDEMMPKCQHLEWNGRWFGEVSGYCERHARPITPPRCSVAQVIARAATKGAPAGALATITLRDSDNHNEWSFSVRDEPRDVYFTTEIDDDCQPVVEKP